MGDGELPLERVYHWERERAGRPFLTQPLRGEVLEWTWAGAMNEVRRVAAWLKGRNWPPGARIAILSKNSAWWMMADLATWMAGHASVPVYASATPATVRALLEHSEPAACFIGAVDDARIVAEAIPAGIARIALPNAPLPEPHSWRSIVAATAPLAGYPVRGAPEVATIVYTSGTTGAPRGAMHRFAAFAHFAKAATRVVGDSAEQRMLSYLPLAHIAERALVEATALYAGAHVYFVESPETFLEDLRRARPTAFFSVPRLYLKFQQRVLERMPQARLNRLLRIPGVSGAVKRRIRRQLGMESVRIAASGAAALPVATIEWYASIGFHLLEGYGMTETGITHTPGGGRFRPGYVGDGAPGVETRLAGGEIQVRSPMNMIGYFRDPEATRAAFTEDGFFRTGDLGQMDGDGWLRIRGRVKELFKTSKGKYVSPAEIEARLRAHPAVEECCVMGDGLASAFAIVALPPEYRACFTDEAPRARLEQSFRALLEEVNGQLEAHERLAFVVVTNEPWSVQNGMLTPTMKLRRSMLEARWAAEFEGWAAEGRPVVWRYRAMSMTSMAETTG